MDENKIITAWWEDRVALGWRGHLAKWLIRREVYEVAKYLPATLPDSTV